MSKYEIQEKGYGKFKHKVPKEISEKKAENLRKEGRKIYDSKEDAKREC